jgi:GAF domain-containing protein
VLVLYLKLCYNGICTHYKVSPNAVHLGANTLSAVLLRRLVNKHQVRSLLTSFAGLVAAPATLALADTRGQWLAAHPAAPGDTQLVQHVCETAQAASDERAIATPIVVEGDLCGILYCSAELEPAIATVQQTLQILITSALSQKSLARETLERYREINLLYRIHETIGASLDLSQVVRAVLEESIGAIKADGGSVLLADDLTDRLVARDSVGLDVADAERILIDQAFSVKILETGKPSTLNDLEQFIQPGNASKAQLVSLLGAPLKSAENTLGVITLGRTRAGDMFTAGDQKLLMALASQAGVAIANAREVEAREHSLKQQIEALRIEIDEARKQREVYAITESEFFANLQENARQMRAEFNVSE